MILKIPIHSDSNINENYPYIYIYIQHHQITRVIHYPPGGGYLVHRYLLRGTRLVEQFDPVYSSKTILQRRLN